MGQSELKSEKNGLGVSTESQSFVERYLIMPKLIYFILNLFIYAYSSTMPFFFIEFMEFDLYYYGYITSLSLFTFFGSMLWSSLADKTGRYKTIIVTTSILYTLTACFLAIKLFENRAVLLWYNIVLFTFFNFFLSASFPLVDAMILGMLAKNPNVSKEQMGNQRLFSAFGHLASTFITMFVYEKFGNGHIFGDVITKKAFAQIVVLIVVLLLFIAIVVFGIPDVQPVKGGHHGHHASESKDTKSSGAVKSGKSRTMQLLTNPSFFFFIFFVFCSGVVNQVTHNFQKVVANHVFNDNKIMASLVDFSRTFSEVAVYFFSKQIRAFMGVYWVLVFSQLAGTLRLGLYACLGKNVNPFISKTSLFIIELLKGLNSGLLSSSAIMIASNLAPAGCEGTAQGMYSGIYKGLGAAFGGIISGAILQILFMRNDKKRQAEKATIKQAKEDTYSDDDSKSKAIKTAKLPTKEMDQVDVRVLFAIVSLTSVVVTVLLSCKFIFIDRVMGIPGFPRRH